MFAPRKQTDARNRLTITMLQHCAKILSGFCSRQIEVTLHFSARTTAQIPDRDFGCLSVSGAWKRNGCDAIATAHTAQALSMKVPSRSSRAARCNWACVFRAETGFLLLLPGPLPRRHCRRERASDCRVRSRIRASLPSISFSGYRRTALMRIRVTCGSHRDVRRSSALPQ